MKTHCPSDTSPRGEAAPRGHPGVARAPPRGTVTTASL